MRTFSIQLPEGDLREIDEEATRQKRSRNNLIQVIIEAWLDKERERD